MKKLRPLLLATLLTLLGACVASVHPFYTDADVVFDARLIGSWGDADKDDQERWQFSAAGANHYELLVTENQGKTGSFTAYLFKIGEHTFLDLTPRKVDFSPKQAGLVEMSVIPGHLLIRVYQLQPSLKLAFTDVKWLEDLLKKTPGVIAHRLTSDAMVLTAHTRELQAFVLAHVADGELFGKSVDATDLVRRTDLTPAASNVPR